MQIRFDAQGVGTCVYSEAIDLAALGTLSLRRGSHVEPDAEGQWWADLAPVRGPKLGPFAKRSEALRAEMEWLDAFLFNSH